eukprot:GHVN01037347.1.p1 GENE.GHVN01037347.1~~GHVN01037347.1.p1  ORF type:complete len:205 (+),score=23.13 GHVN01037347.1:541-1155(+)
MPIVQGGSIDQTPMPVPRADSASNEDDIIITKLGFGQSLKCYCTATKGIGKLHAKFIPVATAVYKYEPIVMISDQMKMIMTPEQKKAIVDCCPRKVFSMDVNPHYEGDIEDIYVRQPSACIFCNECVEVANKLRLPQAVQVKYHKDVFHFTVETTGCMSPATVVEIAMELLQKKIDELRRCLASKDELTEAGTLPGLNARDLDA